MTITQTEGVAAPKPTYGKLKLFVTAIVAIVLAELIGAQSFSLGPGKIMVLPMLWALLLATLWGALHARIPAPLGIGRGLQVYSGAALNTILLFFVVKMGLTVGGALPQIREAGWALIFQETGHFFGTMALGLPLALLLGIKREAIGATFSVGREGSLMIIGERYGLDSAEGRGVLAEYITGTVLGAVFLATLAGFLTSLGIFDPRSLAMGAGVGSGSLMAAALGAIVAQTEPAMQAELTAIAAAANLLTSVGGFYFTMFISLPLCVWLYQRLEPVLGRFSRPVLVRDEAMGEALPDHARRFAMGDTLAAWLFMCIGTAISNYMGYKVPFIDSLEGLLVIFAFVAGVTLLKAAIPRLPVLVVLSLAAAVLSIPGLHPLLDVMVAKSAQVNFLAFTTPILALAGFSVAKDLPIFRQLGWRIVAVSLTAGAGTFIGAVLVAEFFH